MGFEPFVKSTVRTSEPCISISTSGLITLNAACVKLYDLGLSKFVECAYDNEHMNLKLNIVEKESKNTIKLKKTDAGSLTFGGKSMLKYFEIDDTHTMQYEVVFDKTDKSFLVAIGAGRKTVRKPRTKKTETAEAVTPAAPTE
jgi:hypothetical protein